jgi:hypothetical protein
MIFLRIFPTHFWRTRNEADMSLRAEQFRQRADECSRQAKKCPDHSERNHWLKMAEQWLKMAEAEMQISGRRGTSLQRNGALGHIEPTSGRRPNDPQKSG